MHCTAHGVCNKARVCVPRSPAYASITVLRWRENVGRFCNKSIRINIDVYIVWGMVSERGAQFRSVFRHRPACEANP